MFIDYSGFLKLFEDDRVVNSTNVVNNGFEGFLLFRVRLKVQTDDGENFQELCKVEDVFPTLRMINVLQVSPCNASFFTELVFSGDCPDITHEFHEIFFLHFFVRIF